MRFFAISSANNHCLWSLAGAILSLFQHVICIRMGCERMCKNKNVYGKTIYIYIYIYIFWKCSALISRPQVQSLTHIYRHHGVTHSHVHIYIYIYIYITIIRSPVFRPHPLTPFAIALCLRLLSMRIIAYWCLFVSCDSSLIDCSSRRLLTVTRFLVFPMYCF